MITEAQETALERYVTDLAQRMHLATWHLSFDHGEGASSDDTDAAAVAAEVIFAGPYLQARIVVYPRFWEAPPEQQRFTMVHELFHVVVRRWARVQEDFVYGGFLPMATANLMHGTLKGEEEYTIDHVTTIIAPWLPLPELSGAQEGTHDDATSE